MAQAQSEPQQHMPSRWVNYSVCFALLAAVLAVAARNSTVSLDVFHELALIRQAVDEGAIPQTDAFAYTPTVSPVVHHEWGTGAILYVAIVSSGLGAGGLMALKYALTFALCLGCYFCARMKGSSFGLFVPFALVALAIGGDISFTSVRAQLFTLLFLVIQFALLECDRRGGRKWIAAWLVLAIVWSNVHGGIVAGIGILGIYAFAKFVSVWIDAAQDEQLAGNGVARVVFAFWKCHYLIWVVVATLAALLVNPYGLEYPVYLFRGVLLKRPLVAEWQPFFQQMSDPSDQMLFVVSILIAIAAFWGQARLRVFEILAVLLTAYLTIKHVRHLSMYTVTWLCLVPAAAQGSRIGDHISNIWRSLSTRFAIAACCLGLVASGMAVRSEFWQLKVPSEPVVGSSSRIVFPVGAVEYLRERKFVGNLMVPFQAGAFVSWNLFPAVKVSIDGRYEVAYPPGLVDEATDFYAAKGDWPATLDRYDTDAVLVPGYSPLNELLGELPEWHLHYRDRGYSLYFPHEAASGPVIRTGDRTSNKSVEW